MCKIAQKQSHLTVFNKRKELKIIEKVLETEIGNVCYSLPHIPVVRKSNDSTTIRSLFYAAAREKIQPSLND